MKAHVIECINPIKFICLSAHLDRILVSVNCPVGSIPIASGSYTGAIDDFRLYNRELDSQELCVLNHM
jgi:hypothetical protein